MSEIYRKVGRRYHPVGHEWQGWPADGWWLVRDGSQSLIEPLDSPNPLPRIQAKQYRDDVVAAVSMRMNRAQVDGASLADLVDWTLDALADAAEWEGKP
jgi:hypothetical protein